MLKGFRDFILKGNVVDLAVAVVIGTAFAAVVAALVAGIVTPLIGAIFGEPSFGDLTFTINESEFLYGAVINALITFLSVAAVIYFVVVTPINRITERLKPGKAVDQPTRSCPECISDIPCIARRCAFCTAQVTPATV
ncbi:MAG: large conductance mechanosensitive channel protein MscL [Solirubrobacteraceae bacterium]